MATGWGQYPQGAYYPPPVQKPMDLKSEVVTTNVSGTTGLYEVPTGSTTVYTTGTTGLTTGSTGVLTTG